MNSLGAAVVLAMLAAVAVLAFFLRGLLKNLADAAAEHAKNYAGAYAKGAALMALAIATQFDDTFRTLTREQADALNWWGWCVLFSKPLAAALTAILGFMDQSVARAKASREERANTGAPFVSPTPAK